MGCEFILLFGGPALAYISHSIFDEINLSSASTVSGVIAKNTELAFAIASFLIPAAKFFVIFYLDSGWDIYRSNNVSITNSNITNGDDCVSFKPNSTNMYVDHLICDGSHGVSVSNWFGLPPDS